MKAWARKQTGFTIVELLIVIVVIGILAAISLIAYNGVQNRAKVSQTNTLFASIKKGMLAYKVDKGELPPIGDAWNYDTNPPSCGYPSLVVTTLRDEKYATGLSARDAWGYCWGYDDNDCNSGANSASNLVSVGPNGVFNGGTGDDILVQISPGC
jgi:type II secretion system protein G